MSTAPTASPQPPAGGPPAAPKSGGGAKVFLWILGIFAGFFVLIIVAFAALGFYAAHKIKQAAGNPVYAAAKFMVAANPDLETVTSDDSSGTITVRDRKTGKVSTMKVDPDKKVMVVTDENGKSVTMKLDTAHNKLVMTDEHGKTASITADAQSGNVEIKSQDGTMKLGAGADKAPDWVPVYPGAAPQNTFSASDDKSITGSYVFTTKDPVDKVLGYYGDTLKAGGFKISNTTTNSNGKVAGLVSGSTDGDKQTVIVTAGEDTDGTKVSVSYNSKK
ncbi:MAG TPA: hypothetical protein VKW06_10230 [Candidatus Angelobacter sp.]|nr:hypothetical protein [Candidatus Angelobacter sp.]